MSDGQEKTRRTSADMPTVVPDKGSSTMGASGVLTVGQQWGKYVLEKQLGGGGQADVFQAYDRLGTAGHVALKIPHGTLSPAHVSEWVEAEAGTLVRLKHPNIVRVVDAGIVSTRPYVATALVDGLPMSKYVKSSPPSMRTILNWMIQLTQAIQLSHEHGAIHRDLKPNNVIVTHDGRPLLIDFGMASLVTAYAKETRQDASGTYPFMAPEQARGEGDADLRVDVFGLGAVLKFLLTGQGPYHSAKHHVRAVLQGQVEFVPNTAASSGVGKALIAVANKALDPSPEKRYQNATELLMDLQRIRRRGKILTGVVTALFVLGLAGVVIAKEPWKHWASGPGAGVGPGGAVEEDYVRADLNILFQRRDQEGSHQELNEKYLPLHTGDRIQIRGELEEPMHAYLIACTRVSGEDGDGGATALVDPTLLYPTEGQADEPVTEISYPGKENDWIELTSPTGTETFLLLARREAVSDPEAMLAEITAMGSAPKLDSKTLLVLDHKGSHERTEGARALGSKVTVEKGFLEALQGEKGKDWEVIRAVVFPQLFRGEDE